MNNNVSKKTIYFCESSITIKKFFLSVIDDSKLNICFFEDSYEFIKSVYKDKPDCVFVSSNSHPVKSFEIVKILKSSSITKNIFLVFYYNENEFLYKFWCDKFNVDYSLCLFSDIKNEFLKIEQIISKIANDSYCVKDNIDFTDKDLAFQISQVLKDDFFENIIIKSLYDVSISSKDLSCLVKNIFTIIDGLVTTEALILQLCNNNTIYQFKKINSKLNESEKKDFLQVCESELKSNISALKNFNIEITEIKNMKFETELKNIEKINSYNSFNLTDNNFLGILNLGSTRLNYFSDSDNKKISFLLKKSSKLFSIFLENKNLIFREKKLKSLFSRFVPVEVIEDLINTSDNHKTFVGQKQQVAVLICDIRHFTTISEYNQPEDVVNFLNKYFTVMVDIIKKHGGSIDKFMGDAIMALFGAPVSYIDNCDRAVQAAIEMKNVVKKISTENLIFPEGCNELDIGIGIHYGNVIFGSIGCAEKTDYTVIGDSVNLASRLEGLTKQYGVKIVVSQDVVDNLKKDIFIRNLDRVKVKGKSIAVSIYTVDSDTSEYNLEYLDYYRKALDLYFLGGWKLSSEYFEKCLQLVPNDVCASCMLNRCIEFAQNPPENWDGATSLTTK